MASTGAVAIVCCYIYTAVDGGRGFPLSLLGGGANVAAQRMAIMGRCAGGQPSKPSGFALAPPQPSPVQGVAAV